MSAREEFLAALTVEHTTDEFGADRYFVADGLSGDWLGDVHSSREAALEEIERIRTLTRPAEEG